MNMHIIVSLRVPGKGRWHSQSMVSSRAGTRSGDGVPERRNGLATKSSVNDHSRALGALLEETK